MNLINEQDAELSRPLFGLCHGPKEPNDVLGSPEPRRGCLEELASRLSRDHARQACLAETLYPVQEKVRHGPTIQGGSNYRLSDLGNCCFVADKVRERDGTT